MINKDFSLIRKQVSGLAAMEDIAAIIQYHRIPASPGYRDAAQYIVQELVKAGIDAHIESFPANQNTRFWTARSFQEWDVTSAALDLVEPKDHVCKLADFCEIKLSLVQQSASFEGTVEVVLLDDGLTEAGYSDMDFTGKIVLTKDPVDLVRRLAVDKHGAVGIIFYGMTVLKPVRELMDLPDALQYASFHWADYPGEKRCFGFVLSQRSGEWLRRLIQIQTKENLPPVKVHAQVSSRFYDGSLDIVTALIPGEIDQEIVIVSHLCHPQPSANDNASGNAAALETARTLHRMIHDGKLAGNKRGIRFLWVPEMIGSYAYLSSHEKEISKLIAGLNLDMVGGNQALVKGSLLLERPPDANSSFVPELVEYLLGELSDDARSHTGLGNFPLFYFSSTVFAGGSDHYIFSDPTVNIPMAMLIQVPDKFYHTSEDTLDKVDPIMLERTISLASGFAYFVASAGQAQVSWLAYEMDARFRARLVQHVQLLITKAWHGELESESDLLERKVVYDFSVYQQSLDSLLNLWDGAETLINNLSAQAKLYAQIELERGRQAIDACSVPQPGPSLASIWETEAFTFIPRRCYRGPVSFELFSMLSEEDNKVWKNLVKKQPVGGLTLPVLAEFWADGRRSALEIIDLIEMETGVRNAELVVRRFEYLEKLKLVKRVPITLTN